MCLAASACTGTILDDHGDDVSDCDVVWPGESPVRRLTRLEYNHTIRDLLGDTTNPADEFPPEEEALGFNNQARSLVVTPILAEQYMKAAEAIAERATADLAALLPCDPAADGEDACARQFVADFGLRAWRRPLDEAEIDRVLGVYAWGKTEHDFGTGIQLAIQTLLQSPHFLYRVEFGAPLPDTTRVVRISDWEMASRLSYLLWGTMPDDGLFAAAAAGELGTPDQVRAHAERMLADPRAKTAVRDFYGQWLQLTHIDRLEKDPAVYPAFYAELRALLREETERFIDHVIWELDGDLGAIFTADFSFMNAELAAYYGVAGPAGDAFEQVSLGPERAGFLTHAGVLATHAKPNQSSPVHRGKFVREQLFCQVLPPPPDNIAIVPPDLDPNLTTRERFSQHSTNPACSGCHQLMDPIGFGFEHFDGAGQWRDDENGLPIDASGELIQTDIDGAFDGVVDLASKLAGSEEVYRCVVQQFFRWGSGRAEAEEDTCALASLQGDFRGSHNLRDLIVAYTQTDAFLYRHPVQP